MASDSLQKAVDALVLPALAKTLPEQKAANPLPAVTKRASTGSSPGSRSAVGIASPLTETAASRTYHEVAQSIYSTDGILAFKVRAVQQLTMTDANAAEVVMIFQGPAG